MISCAKERYITLPRKVMSLQYTHVKFRKYSTWNLSSESQPELHRVWSTSTRNKCSTETWKVWMYFSTRTCVPRLRILEWPNRNQVRAWWQIPPSAPLRGWHQRWWWDNHTTREWIFTDLGWSSGKWWQIRFHSKGWTKLPFIIQSLLKRNTRSFLQRANNALENCWIWSTDVGVMTLRQGSHWMRYWIPSFRSRIHNTNMYQILILTIFNLLA